MVYYDVNEFVKTHLNRKKQLFVYSQHTKYIRICAGFDIETTRIDKYAFMYHWQLSFNDDDLLCRTWADFEFLIDALQKWLEPKKAVLILWVANMGHEFSFLCRRFRWKKIFARESHSPLTARTGRVEFRECLSISGQGGLANLAKNYCKTQKLRGDLDYNVIRNSQTVLEPETELQYCINDTRILAEWAQYIFTQYSDNKKDIPLTATSIVRNDIKQAVELTGAIEKIRDAVYSLYPTRQTYNFIMQYLFRGGYTHANIWYTCVKWENTIGVDFTSSYPAVMLHCYYPMSPFNECECGCNGKEITDSKLETNCMWIVVDIEKIEQITSHAIESKHKLIACDHAEFDNGRLTKADRIQVALTEIDYKVYTMFYKWEKITVIKSLCAVRGKLPNYVLNPLKNYYTLKQELKRKGLDSTIEYKNAKARLNSFYGCMVTRLTFIEHRYNQDEPFIKDDEIIDTGEWYTEETTKTYSKLVDKQILSPYWGIYVTAHARYRLLSMVAKMDCDTLHNSVIYCDTDSIYFDDTPENRKLIAEYNAEIAELNKDLPPEFYDIGFFDWVDKTKDGNPVTYQFETLGAKRYIKYYNEHAEVVVSGMRKGTFERKIMRTFASDNSYPIFEKYRDDNGQDKKRRIGYVDIGDLFTLFTDNFLLQCDESDKLASIYAHDAYEMQVTDEQGHTEIMREKSGVALYPIPFKIKMEQEYILLLQEIMEKRRLVCKM